MSSDRSSHVRRELAWWGALGVLMLVAAAQLDHLGRGRSFFYDDWTFVIERRGPLVDALLRPHNGHLSVLPVGVFRTMFEVVGLDHYRPYRWLAIGTHLTVVALVAVLVRRAAGWWLAFPMAGAVAFLGSGWQNTLWPFQIGSMGSIAAGLAAHALLVDRRRDLWAALLVGVSLACSSLGLPIAAGVAVRLAVRRTDWVRMWVVVAPGALWGVWYLGYGESQADGDLSSLGSSVATSAAGAVAGLGDLTVDWGRLLAGLGIGLWLAVLVHRRTCSPEVAAWAATAGIFWILTSLSRSDVDPAASRYVYFGAIFVLLLIAEYAPRSPHLVAVAAVWVVLALGIWGNQSILRAGAGGLRQVSEAVSAELYSLELARDVAPADYKPDPVRAPPMVAGEYFEAIDTFGSPAADAGTVAAAGDEARQQADRVLLDLYRPELRSLGGAMPADCEVFDAGDEVQLPADGLVFATPSGGSLELGLRRFGDLPAGGVVLAVERIGRLELPPDASDVAWRVQATSGTGQVCRG